MNSKISSPNSAKICIGLPVYNGEKFIKSRLDEILSQTYANFHLIISDNASLDRTSSICKDYLKKDQRIRYIRQKKNIGVFKNYDFVLRQANSEYFVWVAVDDKWDPTFLEKNVKVLTSNKNLVGSICRIGRQGQSMRKFQIYQNDSSLKKFYKKVRSKFLSPFDLPYSLTGSYSRKIRLYLKNRSGLCMFGIFRTKELQESVKMLDLVLVKETTVILNILKHGDINVIDEVLMHWYPHGLSTKGRIKMYKQHEVIQLKEIFFPEVPFTLWFIKNLGKILFFKNLDYFISINTLAIIGIFLDLINYFKEKDKPS